MMLGARTGTNFLRSIVRGNNRGEIIILWTLLGLELNYIRFSSSPTTPIHLLLAHTATVKSCMSKWTYRGIVCID